MAHNGISDKLITAGLSGIEGCFTFMHIAVCKRCTIHIVFKESRNWGKTMSNLDFVKCFLRPLEPHRTPQLLTLLSCYEQIRFLCRDSLIGPLEN